MHATNSVLVNPIPCEVSEENVGFGFNYELQIINVFSNFGKVIAVKRANPWNYAYWEVKNGACG